ncbi:MAG: ATP-binding protein [Bacteroidetes bacterium]|nr:ATP-binding protein [Bacteroidota bacterium]
MRILLTFMFLLIGILLQGQDALWKSISAEQGLSQGFVPSIAQDDDGFLWIATKNGLNRYDGYQFKVYHSLPFDSLSLNSNDIIDVTAVGNFLFVVTNAAEPMLFNCRTQRFYGIPGSFGGNNGVLAAVYPFGKNSVWVWFWNSESNRLYHISWPSDPEDLSYMRPAGNGECRPLFKVEKYPVPKDFQGFRFSQDEKKQWLLTRDSILVRKPGGGSIRSILLPDEIRGIKLPEHVSSSVFPQIAGASWVIRKDKIARYDGRNWKVFALPVDPAGIMQADCEAGILWIRTGTRVCGLDLTLSAAGPRLAWDFEVGKPVKCGLTDRTGILWFGTDAHGILKFSPRKGAFTNYLEGVSIYCKPVFNGINHVLLIDVRQGGWFSRVLDIGSGKAVDFKELGMVPPYGNNICATENGAFWWTFKDPRLNQSMLMRYNPETGLKETIPLPKEFICNLPALKYVEPGQVWVVTPRQMLRYTLADRKFRLFPLRADAPAQIIALERGIDGTWWMGTDDGLVKAELRSDSGFRFSILTARKGDPGSLPVNSIKSLLPDPDHPNLLWVGTNGAGLYLLDIPGERFKNIPSSEGLLSDDVIYGILPDDEKPRRLWISTNRGITCFSPEKGSAWHFSQSDGLQDNEFNTYAYFKASSGQLYFGGVNGLTVFDPKVLAVHSKPPPVMFTGLRINGMVVNPRDSGAPIGHDVAFLDKLDLPYARNNIELQFAAMDFTEPWQNQFSYYLEGAEAPWIHRGFEHSAQYINLSPGKYTFRVKAANCNGIWNKQPVSLDIVIRAPWYRTWLAYLVYTALFIVSGFLFNQYQLQQRLRRAEANRLKSLNDFKTRFFTNITHEFRTPLTVILGMTQRLMSEREEPSRPLALIKRNGENLLRLINHILDLSKLESHNLKMNYIQGDVLAYMRYITESLHSLANAQNVMLRLGSDQSEILMDYDPERLMQIVYNLLSNAIKFTPSGGKVSMQVTRDKAELVMTVSDTGRGVPQEDLPRLFDRFFQAKNQEFNTMYGSNLPAGGAGGSGIGLSLTRELITAMGGVISAQSPVPGTSGGTVFIVRLPISNHASMTDGAFYEQPGPDVFTAGLSHQDKAETAKTVLLIEDNPDVTEYLATCLRDRYHLEFSFNGRAGIEKALEIIPDLIISDVMMPEKDGFEVCDFVKNDQRTSHIPIILLTARVTVESRIAGLQRGADAYLSKPFHEEELLVWVEQLIARQKSLQARFSGVQPTASGEILPLPDEITAPEDAFVRKFNALMETHFASPDVSPELLAREIGMSRAQLYRKLATLTGRSVSEHLNAIRLKKARSLLKAGGLNISEVAYQVGYNDPKYFSKLFTESNGMTPSDFQSEA